jgi:CobQ-like glutamine amidotransferase family enzyme
MTAVKLGTIYGDRLNLNGDQANLAVLQKRLAWAGVDNQLIQISSKQELLESGAEYILLGHGSKAAWASCQASWPTLATDFVAATQTTPGLAIGSGASRVVEARGDALVSLDAQISLFAVDSLHGRELLGYKFSEVSPCDSMMVGKALVSWLHGPLLAKNPDLADQVIREILRSRGEAEPSLLSNDNTRKIDEILAGVWRLERP